MPIAVASLIIIILAGITLSGPATANNINILKCLHYLVDEKFYHISEQIGEETINSTNQPPEENDFNLKGYARLTIFVTNTRLFTFHV